MTRPIESRRQIDAGESPPAPANRLPRATVYSLLAAVCVASLILRYPSTSHETGVDSFFIHNLAAAIVRDGQADWILNPLGFVGWYPLSYPSAGPFLFASFSISSGTPVEATILLLSLAIGALGTLTPFMMAREFKDDDGFALIVCFIYGLAPRLMAFTLWTGSARGLFMALLPAFVWFLLRAKRDPTASNVGVVFTLLFLLMATHRLAALMLAVVAALFGAAIFVTVAKILRRRYPHVLLNARVQHATPYLAVTLFATVIGVLLFGFGLLQGYGTGEIFNGSGVFDELGNLVVSLARSVGLALLLAIVGVFALSAARNKTFREPFALLSFVALTPTLFLRVYTGFYILPFVAVLGAAGLLYLARSRNRARHAVVIVVALLLCLGFSAFVLQYEISNASALSPSTYDLAVYLHTHSWSGTVVSNDGLLGVRVASVSGYPYLPVGGGGTTFQSAELLVYGFVNASQVESSVYPIPWNSLSLDTDSPWFGSTIQSEATWVRIMQSTFPSTAAPNDPYHVTYFLENTQYSGDYLAYSNIYPSAYAQTVHRNAYLVYADSSESMWYAPQPVGQ